MSGPTVPLGSLLAKVVLSPRAVIGRKEKNTHQYQNIKAAYLHLLKGPHWSGRLAGSVRVEGIKRCKAARTNRRNTAAAFRAARRVTCPCFILSTSEFKKKKNLQGFKQSQLAGAKKKKSPFTFRPRIPCCVQA